MVKTEISFSYWLTADRREYTVRIVDDSTGIPVTTKRDYDFSKYFNEFAFRYSYEIYNRVNLSAVLKTNRRDYHNDFEISSQKKGWNREFHVMINYEIF